ncbi:hypothetical protein D3C80_1821370 [compost metagenome]
MLLMPQAVSNDVSISNMATCKRERWVGLTFIRMMLPCTFHEKTDRETFSAGCWGIIARASGLPGADGLKRGPA